MKLSFVIYAMFALLVVFGAQEVQLPALPRGEMPISSGAMTAGSGFAPIRKRAMLMNGRKRARGATLPVPSVHEALLAIEEAKPVWINNPIRQTGIMVH